MVVGSAPSLQSRFRIHPQPLAHLPNILLKYHTEYRSAPPRRHPQLGNSTFIADTSCFTFASPLLHLCFTFASSRCFVSISFLPVAECWCLSTFGTCIEVDGDHRPQDRVGTQKDQTCNQSWHRRKTKGVAMPNQNRTKMSNVVNLTAFVEDEHECD
jgi:hypothetical protein